MGARTDAVPADPVGGGRPCPRRRHRRRRCGAAHSLAALRGELDEIEASLDEAETTSTEIPHRTRYLLLVHGFGRALVQAHRQWLEQVERELGDV